MPETRSTSALRSFTSKPARTRLLKLGLVVVSATSLLPAEAGAAEDRAVAILLTVIAGTIAGLLGCRWAGFGFGLGLGWFHLQVRELFGSAEETLAPLLPVYVIVTGGVAWLSAAVTDALRESWQASSILKSELAESERRQRVVQAISRVGAELSAHPSASDPVSHALTELCKALDLDVIIVRRNHDRRRRLSSDIESWITRSGSEAPAHGDGEFSWEALPYMRDRLASGEPCAFSSLDELPVPDRETLSSGIPRLESVLNIPVMDGDRWLGHAAFGSKTRGKPWTAEEVTSLSILTDMIASAWRREYQTNQLMMAFEARETALTAQRALTEGTNLLLAPRLRRPPREDVEPRDGGTLCRRRLYRGVRDRRGARPDVPSDRAPLSDRQKDRECHLAALLVARGGRTVPGGPPQCLRLSGGRGGKRPRSDRAL